MHLALPTLLALATASTTSAIALPATINEADATSAVPDLPNGFFAGYNNPDGTSTLHFVDTNQNFTFVPTPESSSITPSSHLSKRVLASSCWSPTLSHPGVDGAMSEMRTRLSHTAIGVGQYSDWPPYFGYNNNGVYVYVCENSGIAGVSFSLTTDLFNRYSYAMDQRCGAYVAGYVEETFIEVPTRWLWGKAVSGTRVCLGNWRSPR